MSASTSSPASVPTTPPNRMPMNRSFTLPPKFDSTQTPQELSSTDGVETLFVHPHSSIIKFSTSSRARGLAWTSPTETTIAAGSLELYRVPGSVSFLHSGTLLHAIMPRSQCWCLDGISKFALRVLPDTYYRIELPGQTKEELELVEDFKKALGMVMHYEKTACPFARDNTTEELPELEDIRNRRLRPEDNAKWLLDRSRLRKTSNTTPPPVSDGMKTVRMRQSSQQADLQEHSPTRSGVTQARETKPRLENRSITAPPKLIAKPLDQSLRSQFETVNLKQFQSIPTDMPPSPPDSSAGPDARDQDRATIDDISESNLDAQEGAGDQDSSVLIHSQEDSAVDDSMLDCPQEELEGSDLFIDRPLENSVEDNSVLTKPQEDLANAYMDTTEHQLVEHIQDLLVLGASKEEVEDVLSSTDDTLPGSTALPADSPIEPPLTRQISSEDPFAAIQARILARRSIGGTTSFYPSTVRESTSCSTSSVSSTSTLSTRSIVQQRNLASALVRKACTMFLGPPAHLVVMMLRIAARFANGTFGNMFFVESPSGTSRRIPGSFEVHQDISDGISDDEDDFGVPLHSPIRLATVKGLRERHRREGGELD